MRLIDADTLMERIEASWKDCGLHGTDYHKIKRWINAMPTIEADIKCEDCKTITALKAALEPVKRGKWIKVSDRNYKCSVCGDWWSGEEEEIKTFIYCPNCGAKMDSPTIIEAEEGEEE